MAKKYSFPYMLREAISNAEELFGLDLGIPMNAQTPQIPEDGETEGTIRAHFAMGTTVKARVVLYRDDQYGQAVGFRRLELITSFSGSEGKDAFEVAHDFVAGLEALAGVHIPSSYEGKSQARWDDMFKIVLEGEALAALSVARSEIHYGIRKA